jgi:hypothetical protein
MQQEQQPRAQQRQGATAGKTQSRVPSSALSGATLAPMPTTQSGRQAQQHHALSAVAAQARQ